MWHARTRLYEEVVQLREQARRDGATIAELRAEAARSDAARDARHAEPPASSGGSEQGEPGAATENARFGEVTQEFGKEQRLLADIRRGEAVGTPEERKRLLDFLLDALKQVERVFPNGSDGIEDAGAEPDGRQKPPEWEQSHRSPDWATESKNAGPSSQ